MTLNSFSAIVSVGPRDFKPRRRPEEGLVARRIVLGIVGDYDGSFPSHVRTNEAIEHAARALGLGVDAAWIPTAECDDDAARRLAGCDGVWISPGSPYKSMDGALAAIRACRLGAVPLLATCGGCQHVIIEYARSVLGHADAEHAEHDPYASTLFVTPLSCSLVGKTMPVTLEAGSAIAAVYGETRVEEQYYCNFGLNPARERDVHEGGLSIVGRDPDGEPRIFTLPEHPFFVATLFVPSLTSSPERPHPLVVAWVRAAAARSRPTRLPSCL
jgi:CTP synthase (UTP-ammonia lyase)